jgi:V8-like Glu-specific endopeptidase
MAKLPPNTSSKSKQHSEDIEWIAAPEINYPQGGSKKIISKSLSPLESELLTECHMVETNGGGRIENVPGLNIRRAMTAGLAGGMPINNLVTEKLAVSDTATPEAVFGDDDRVALANTASIPWRSICHLLIERQDGRSSFGTAWFAGPRLLITAGHCILAHSHGGWATNITVVPGSNGAYPPPFGSFQAVAKEVHPAWRDQADERYDVGFLQLSDSVIGSKLGWFGVSVIDDNQASELLVNIGGYPDDKKRGTLWCNAGRITGTEPYFFRYMIDTHAGESGAPVFWYGQGGQRIAVAVHTYSEMSNNKGRRILPDVFKRIQQLRKL